MTHEELEQAHGNLSGQLRDLNSRIVLLESKYTEAASSFFEIAKRLTAAESYIAVLEERIRTAEPKTLGAQLVTGNRDKGING